jgi:hypothetical protein
MDRQGHGQALARAAAAAKAQGDARRVATEQSVGRPAISPGLYIQFESWPGFELKLSTMDPVRGAHHPELVAVHEREVDGRTIQEATVLVPDGGLAHFLSRFDAYATEDTRTGKPMHADFVERVAGLRLATIEALWTDPAEDFPEADAVVWWEAWLRRSDGEELTRLAEFAEGVGLQLGERQLQFDNRIIVLLKGSANQLASALDIIDDLAELRSARTPPNFFEGMEPGDQGEWVQELLDRTEGAATGAPAVCVLDTGVNRGHPLLEHSLGVDDIHACDPAWGTHDHDGHGTEMAGLALYGDLQAALEDTHPVRLLHGLESVKVLPPTGANDPDLYGAITAEAVARVEVQAPARRRTFSMSITAGSDPTPGAPTSWSASVDALAAGRSFDPQHGELRYIDDGSVDAHRLFVISAGNVNDDEVDYLQRCDVEPIEDPAQAWNALTVGAYTERFDLSTSGPDFADWTPVAEPGDLSPFSRTSVLFERQWPIKPEVVLEGGNTCVSPSGTDFDFPPAFQVLTTHRDPNQRLLTTTTATSAATAQAGQLAGAISAAYPSLWPETVRALIVHSAEWTPQMRQRFADAGTSKTAREALARRYGFGVPSLERALLSAANALTLVLQDTIHPFRSGALREMHTHELPWPVQELADLGSSQVRLRATLSYFVEPHPTRRGWKRRYRYASHGLRFELKRPEETDGDFLKRLNKRALDEEEDRPTVDDDAAGWTLGSQARNRGSIHSDIWTGTAADLAARGRLAIFPVTGWWKEHNARDQSGRGARYAVVLSIETPVETVDLWTPVAAQIGVPIPIEITST